MEVYLGTKQSDGSTVAIHGNDRRKHMAIFGKSGVGKTTLMRNMVMADLAAGNGVTVVDPHGSLIDDLISVIPRHRTNDVIVSARPTASFQAAHALVQWKCGRRTTTIRAAAKP